MKKSILIASLAVLITLGYSFKGGPVLKELTKITICHIPPGNEANCHEITISMNAFNQHITHHGDALICHDPAEVDEYVRLGNLHGLKVVFDGE